MPKRVLDFEAMWASSKLARCPEWVIPEYAWLYGLADANGSFELTDLGVLWRKVAAIRPAYTLDTLAQAINLLNKHGLLFIWAVDGRRYGHWTGSEKAGRLPRPSWRKRVSPLAPCVPAGELATYLQACIMHATSVYTLQACMHLSSSSDSSLNLNPIRENSEPIEESRAKSRILLEIWERERGALPPVRAFTTQRASKCRARLSETDFSLEDFTQAVRKARTTPFLNGANDRGWRASFDWLIANDTNYLKVLEGRYDNANGSKSSEARIGQGPTGARIKPGYLSKIQREADERRQGRVPHAAAGKQA